MTLPEFLAWQDLAAKRLRRRHIEAMNAKNRAEFEERKGMNG